MTPRHTAEIEFPTAGTAAHLNRVRVIAYPERHHGTKSCPHSSKSSEVKKILGYARYDEDIDTIDMDVVVHFDDPDFAGQSYGLALVLADKCARYGAPGKYRHIVATGVVGKQGLISRVEAFEEKLEWVEKALDRESLFAFPRENLEKNPATLERLKTRCAALQPISQLDEIRELWQTGIVKPNSPVKDGQPTVPDWRPFLRGMIVGFILVMLAASTLIVFNG